MAAIHTFDLEWPLPDGQARKLNCALGHPRPHQWIVVVTSLETPDSAEDREWFTISVRAVAEPEPAPSAEGNSVIAFKNYSENKNLLERLESLGIVKHTGRKLGQGLVQLDMVEILVPRQELIRQCSGCWKWEVVGEERFKWCAKCKRVFYCLPTCQKKDWKGHKYSCREGAPPYA